MKPNIIMVNPDQMRADSLYHMGNQAASTPVLDNLIKAEAVSFRRAFCQNPVCVPSRCSFISGMYPHIRGHRTMYHMLQPDEPVLFEELKKNGYHVWLSNRNDFLAADSPRLTKICDNLVEPGFASFHQGPERRTETDMFYSFYRGISDSDEGEDSDWAVVHKAIEFIRSRPKDKPFCLFLPLFYPHVPYQIERHYYNRIDPTRLPPRIPVPQDWHQKPKILRGIYEKLNMDSWTEEQYSELRAVYLAMCARVDEQIGMVLSVLKEEGIYDESAFFMFSDHGDYTGDYGLVEKNQNTFEDCLTNVPFVLKPPKAYAIHPGIRENLVELVDVYATIKELCGLPDTHTLSGKSLVPVFTQKDYVLRDAVFAEGGRLNGEVHAMDTGNGANVSPYNEYYPRLYQQTMEDGSHTKATMCRTRDFKYVRRLYEGDEFYDLRTDPGEQTNQIDNPRYKDRIMEHKERLLTWYQETCDIVPYRLDSRMSLESVIRTYDEQLSADLKEQLRAQFGSIALNGKAMHDIMGMIAQAGVKL